MSENIVCAALKEFDQLESTLGTFRQKTSDPWYYLEQHTNLRIPYETDYGIYLFTKPSEPDWKISLDENRSTLWYVGKSAGDIGGRVWNHLGNVYNENGERCDPPCRAHQWAGNENVDASIRDAIAHGCLVVYTVKIEMPGNLNQTQEMLLPELLEKHILMRYFLKYGRLPALNFQF